MSLIDQIDKSLDKATNLQLQRFQQEENRQKSLNSEISYLRQQLHNEDDPQLDMSSYSPLRDDIKQLELQNEILSDKKSEQQQYQYSDTDPDEAPIEPIYQANRPNKIQSKSPLIKPKHIHHKKQQEKQLHKPKKSINLQNQQQQQYKQQQYQQQQYQQQQQQQQQIHLQENTIKHRKVKTLQIHEQILDNSIDKENYVIQEDKYQNHQLQQKIYQVKQQVSDQLTTKTVVNKNMSHHYKPETEQKQYQIRGLRDQAELKYFGRVLPCNECVYLLNKGMSSDYCSQHGKINKEKPRNKAIPSRFGKYY